MARHLHIAGLVALGLATAAMAPACGSDETGNPGGSSSSSSSSSSGSGGSTSSGGGSGAGGSAQGGAGGGSGIDEVTVAFLGDSGYGSSFEANLELIKDSGADFALHLGDFDYAGDPGGFWDVIDGVLGAGYPYFTIVGNHDIDQWPGYAARMAEHFAAAGVQTDDPDYLDEMYSSTFLGVRLAFVGQSGDNDTYAQFIADQIADDEPGWSICGWHKNQTAMQLGGKGNDMGWGVYETCRQKGAIIATGHEHSYSRTKTLLSMETQQVDASCGEPGALCVGPGRTFAFVQGLGGHSIRDQLRCLPAAYPYGCNQEWAFAYTNQQNAQYGVLFIVFNEGGDPKRAHGWFETIDGTQVDEFVITRD